MFVRTKQHPKNQVRVEPIIMNTPHKVLVRQIKKFLGASIVISPEWEKLLEAISTTYFNFDADRTLTERSMDLSSKELIEINRGIEEKVKTRTKEFQQEHARLLASVSSFPLGLLLFDPDNTIILRNENVASILEIATPYYTATDIVLRFPKETDITENCRLCVTEKRSIELKDISIGKKFVRVLISPIFLNMHTKEDVLGYTFLIEDVTEQKILERSKEEFFSIASHELRTPLTVIRGNASILQHFYMDKIADAEVREMIGDMLTSSERLIRMVNDFLDMSRLEQKSSNIIAEAFDLTQIISEAAKELQELAAKKNLELRFDVPKEALPTVMADKDHVMQVLINLIANAINYTHEGSIVISVKSFSTFLKVLITDTGTGISPQNQALLFRKFQQAGNSRLVRDVTGTGLGLYISKLIIEEMGGVIALEESIVGKGSTFSFTLPLAVQSPTI